MALAIMEKRRIASTAGVGTLCDFFAKSSFADFAKN